MSTHGRIDEKGINWWRKGQSSCDGGKRQQHGRGGRPFVIRDGDKNTAYFHYKPERRGIKSLEIKMTYYAPTRKIFNWMI